MDIELSMPSVRPGYIRIAGGSEHAGMNPVPYGLLRVMCFLFNNILNDKKLKQFKIAVLQVPEDQITVCNDVFSAYISEHYFIF